MSSFADFINSRFSSRKQHKRQPISQLRDLCLPEMAFRQARISLPGQGGHQLCHLCYRLFDTFDVANMGRTLSFRGCFDL